MKELIRGLSTWILVRRIIWDRVKETLRRQAELKLFWWLVRLRKFEGVV